jgi:single-stranded-DNA-specific exonuclease
MSSLWRKQWRVCPTAPQQLLDCLPELHPLVAQVLYKPHLTEPEEITAFLEGTLVSDNPFLLADMNRAVTLIRQAVTDRAPIAVYGDYDVDGITATAIMVQTLRSLGADARPYIPDRFEEGYGLNADAIQALAKEGVRLMITVDCGIRSPNEVAVARSCGMQVVVTDHHHISGPLPEAEAAINPKRQDSKYPFRDLAGSGVAYKLAQALLRVNSKTPLRTTVSELSEAELLDLVALGTVADMVPLLGENHVLVRQGLEQLNAACRPGMAALMQTSGAKPGGLTPSTIGYTFGPRLNAAGRMGDSMVAFDLLMAQDFSTAWIWLRSWSRSTTNAVRIR